MDGSVENPCADSTYSVRASRPWVKEREIPFLAGAFEERGRLAEDLMRTCPRVFAALQKVDWAAGAHGATVQDMGVDHGCLDVLVPQQFLDGANVMPALQSMCGERYAVLLVS